jgi:hypothetical protein
MALFGTTDSLYESETLAWVQREITKGQGVLKGERAYNQIQKVLDAVEGLDPSPTQSKAISSASNNKLRKILFELRGALTDVRPIWSYETQNHELKKDADLLSKLTRAWWRNVKADRSLQSGITYSACGGTGYLAVTWNPTLNGAGDLQLVPFDPRDVIPIDPVFSDSIQDWRGVALRERMSIETVKDMFPAKASEIVEGGTWVSGGSGRSGRMLEVVTTVFNFMSGRGSGSTDRLPGSCNVYRIFIKDETIHTGNEPRVMGSKDDNSEYIVYPVGSINPKTMQKVSRQEAKLYPRGRFIMCTETTILKDRPNPYWHGMFPVVRLTLDPLPWTVLGSSCMGDLLSMQAGLNEALRGAEDGIQQWVTRGVVADKSAISNETLRKIDTRKGGMKALLNPNAGQGFQVIDGPQLPPWYLQMLEYYSGQMEENSGTRGLQQLAQLKQMPSSDTLEKFMDALSPILKQRARSLEISLAELAEIVKIGFFQFYRTPRRYQILGEDGVTIQDFDLNPGSMVPEDSPGTTEEEKAKFYHQNFHFSVAPNSFLNISNVMQKMMTMQLFRANGIDIWSLWQALDVPNIGPLPAETIPERMVAARKLGLQPGPTPEVVAAQEKLILLQAQMAQMQAQMAASAPQGPSLSPEGAIPQGGGGGGGIPPQGGGGGPTSGTTGQGGRPPSGQLPPRMISKDGGARTTISESGS